MPANPHLRRWEAPLVPAWAVEWMRCLRKPIEVRWAAVWPASPPLRQCPNLRFRRPPSRMGIPWSVRLLSNDRSVDRCWPTRSVNTPSPDLMVPQTSIGVWKPGPARSGVRRARRAHSLAHHKYFSPVASIQCEVREARCQLRYSNLRAVRMRCACWGVWGSTRSPSSRGNISDIAPCLALLKSTAIGVSGPTP